MSNLNEQELKRSKPKPSGRSVKQIQIRNTPQSEWDRMAVDMEESRRRSEAARRAHAVRKAAAK